MLRSILTTLRPSTFTSALSLAGPRTLLGLGTLALLAVGCDAATMDEDPAAPGAAEDTFDPAQATDEIIDQDGTVVGYYDNELHRRDLDGNLVTGGAAEAAGDLSSALRLVVYSNAHFSGTRHGTLSSVTGTWTLSPSSWGLDNQISSLVVAPGCSAALYDGTADTTPLKVINGSKLSTPSYEDISASYNDRVSKIVLSCKDTVNAFCGNAYKDANYSGDALPFYKDSVVLFSDSKFAGWNDAISSVATNSFSSCDGIGLWEHADIKSRTTVTPTQRRLWVARGVNDSTLVDNGFNDGVSAIETDRELSTGELTGRALGRVLTEERKQRSWGKAFLCSAMKTVCTAHGTLLAGLTSVAGRAICAARIGAGVVEAAAAVTAEIASDATATPVVAPLAAYSATQIATGFACLAATGAVIVTESATCEATMETYCNDNVN